MAICKKCGAKNMPPEQVAFFAAKNGEWRICCQKCPEAKTVTFPASGKFKWLRPGSEGLSPEAAGALNEALVAAGLPALQTVNKGREHERHDVQLTGVYQQSGSPEKHKVVVRDLSTTGVGFMTAQELVPGGIYSIEIKSSSIDFSSEMEVVRCRRAGKHYDVGARFLKGSQRQQKRGKRHPLLLQAFYRREGQKGLDKESAVLNINSSGVALLVNEPFAQDEVFTIRIVGDSGAFAKKEIVGTARVAHSKERYENNYQLGAHFIKTKIRQRQGNGNPLQ